MKTSQKRMIKALIPMLLFIGLIIVFFNAMKNHTRVLPSVLINKPVPKFELPSLMTGELISNETLKGQMYLLNVWGSWCPECRLEHPMITEFAKQKIIPVYGFNYKDEADDAKRWLQQFGNPYQDIIADLNGRVGMDFGVYGAPETFLIDANGIIRHKIVGSVTPQNIQNELLPLIKQYK
jgi:cytochrome c biogenesis protein CcmG/thiol:disulfide interchange protein DsbE